MWPHRRCNPPCPTELGYEQPQSVPKESTCAGIKTMALEQARPSWGEIQTVGVLENYLDTIRREVDEKTRELDELKLQTARAKCQCVWRVWDCNKIDREGGRKRVESASNIIGSSSRSKADDGRRLLQRGNRYTRRRGSQSLSETAVDANENLFRLPSATSSKQKDIRDDSTALQQGKATAGRSRFAVRQKSMPYYVTVISADERQLGELATNEQVYVPGSIIVCMPLLGVESESYDADGFLFARTLETFLLGLAATFGCKQ